MLSCQRKNTMQTETLLLTIRCFQGLDLGERKLKCKIKLWARCNWQLTSARPHGAATCYLVGTARLVYCTRPYSGTGCGKRQPSSLGPAGSGRPPQPSHHSAILLPSVRPPVRTQNVGAKSLRILSCILCHKQQRSNDGVARSSHFCCH